MKKDFENDPLLQELKRATQVKKAPRISEALLLRASESKSPSSIKKFQTPRLLVSLAGGALILTAVSVLTVSLSTRGVTYILEAKTEGSASIAMGNETFTELELLARNGMSLAEFGEAAVGNYVSNHPIGYVDQMWQNHVEDETNQHWAFLVTDAVYIANYQDENTLNQLFDKNLVMKVSSQLATSSDADGIRMLVQGNDSKLYPFVVPANYSPGSLYLELRDEILKLTFTKVPGVYAPSSPDN